MQAALLFFVQKLSPIWSAAKLLRHYLHNHTFRTDHPRRSYLPYIAHSILRGKPTYSVVRIDLYPMSNHIYRTKCSVYCCNTFDCAAMVSSVADHSRNAQRHMIEHHDDLFPGHPPKHSRAAGHSCPRSDPAAT